MGFFDGFGIGDALGVVGTVGGIAANIAGSNKQAKAAKEAAGLSNEQFQQIYGDLAPSRAAGEQALFALSDQLGLPRPVVANNLVTDPTTGEPYPTTDAFNFRQTPGYQFQFNEGVKAIDRGAAARGLLKSGGRLKALERFGQGLADREYGDYMNRLAAIAGLGQTATTQTGQFGAQNALAAGQAGIGAATAQANGLTGAASSFNNLAGNLILANALRG